MKLEIVQNMSYPFLFRLSSNRYSQIDRTSATTRSSWACRCGNGAWAKTGRGIGDDGLGVDVGGAVGKIVALDVEGLEADGAADVEGLYRDGEVDCVLETVDCVAAAFS